MFSVDLVFKSQAPWWLAGPFPIGSGSGNVNCAVLIDQAGKVWGCAAGSEARFPKRPAL